MYEARKKEWLPLGFDLISIENLWTRLPYIEVVNNDGSKRKLQGVPAKFNRFFSKRNKMNI